MYVKWHITFLVLNLRAFLSQENAAAYVSQVIKVPTFKVLSPQVGDSLRNRIISVDVKCLSKQSMFIRVDCDQPCEGNIYANDHLNDPDCHFASMHGERRYEFMLRNNECGTKTSNQTDLTLENTLMFRYANKFQERRLVRCSWSKDYPDEVTATVSVDMLNVRSTTYSGSNVESFMELLKGEGIYAPPISGTVKIGDMLTLVIYVRGVNTCYYDIEVKDCMAHNSNMSRILQLSDTRGCILKDKLMGPWRKRSKVKNFPLVAYSNIEAFRFPGDLDVFFQCRVEVCKFRCPPPCSEFSNDEEDSDGEE